MKPVHIRVTRLGTPNVLAGMLGQMKEAGTMHNPSNEIQHAYLMAGGSYAHIFQIRQPKTHVNDLPHSTI